MAYWLMKSEPSECSIDDLVRLGRVPWTGVRNYRARNYMRDAMQVGDGVLFYHSSCPRPGIAGIAQVASAAYADPTQFDPASRYFDAASRPENPRWLLVDVSAVRRTELLSLASMREQASLSSMQVLQRGNRLSITPVSASEWQAVAALLDR